ncbi:cytosolic carboxypeptidase 3-like isoform X5 [Ruditapes philippinarum]|uniref:cytosolic carboxypeptidase 3-like isoform X5 n=1 Tax=Ruditapes philippinarum TaxID=129788 RepID=UPI00295C2B61|nr:cytosolic carboxypeptidase 3-like isoform X5 [Ruditapes philippinarum]
MTNSEFLTKVNSSKNSSSMMEDRTRSAEARRPHLVHEHSIMISKDKSIGEKKVCIGIRAMSAQERSSLSLKYKVEEDARQLSEKKSKIVKGSDDQRWRDSIRQQMEAELDQRVRDALETPPPEKANGKQANDALKKNNSSHDLENLNAHVLLDLSDKERAYLKSRRWKALQAKRQMQKYMSMNYAQQQNSQQIEVVFRDELSKSNQDEFPGVFGLNSFSEGVKDLNEIHRKQFGNYPSLRQLHKQYYTKEGYLTASRNGKFPDGTSLEKESNGSYEDRFGVVRDQHGPFWPNDWGPLFPAPKFLWKTEASLEPLYYFFKKDLMGKRREYMRKMREADQNYSTVESQLTPFMSKWRGVLIVYDSERSSRDHFPSPVPQGCCPNLLFESRFECGNLRQARRVGQFEYELVLKTDLYTNRHTQWYYFRIQNAVPGVTYRFRIVNLLKRDSLYNYGMRPLVYSELDAKNKGIGWVRTGHHISYSRNVMHLHCPLLMRGIAFYELEWQMEFPNENDTYYLAHCYPYTFTDLKDDLEFLLNDSERQKYIQREVLCETRAGNSCFLVTVTNFDQSQETQDEKKAVIVTARVHPGESQASWMMKGVLDYITGPSPEARTLRDKFIFKMVPMLNPDGVIVGNYRCSLAARDLNRNYRHPKKESFPTVWHTKNMIETVMEKHEVVLYCDLHGHSRKHNVFMYGNNTATDDPDNNNNSNNGVVGARAFLNERLFPWLMAQKSPEKFSFPFCKFNIKRCKEATGRVVMWRQFRILNSFTLEATFSGTAMNKNLAAEECRHFNISDYMEMGHILCQSALEYQSIQENKARQTEIVLEMTRYLTCQVLERRRGVTYKMPNLRAFMKQEQANKNEEEKENSSSQEQPMDQEQYITNNNSNNDNNEYLSDSNNHSVIRSARENSVLDKDEKIKRSKSKLDSSRNNNLSKMDVDNILDAESMKTMDGCLKILAQLHVSEALEESDSSDSDSESEPELKPAPEPKAKKKKRKSKKQRDKEQQERKGGSGGSDKKEERKLSTNCFQCTTAKCHSALPTISGNQGPDRTEGSSRQSQALRGDKYANQKKDPHFVSKYEGRKNGGIPCFAEERSVERAAKQRMAEMKKRTEEEKQKEVAFFVALNEGTSNIAQTLVGLNVRTGYTHAGTCYVPNVRIPHFSPINVTATEHIGPMFHPDKVHIFGKFFDSFRDLAPAVLPATAPQNTATGGNSSSDMSDSDIDANLIPVTARATPYLQDSISAPVHPPFHHSTSYHAQNIFKKHLSLRGPSTMRTVQRHITNSAQPTMNFSNNPSNMIRSDVISSGQNEQRRIEERKRNPGPLTHFGDESVPKGGGLRMWRSVSADTRSKVFGGSEGSRPFLSKLSRSPISTKLVTASVCGVSDAMRTSK